MQLFQYQEDLIAALREAISIKGGQRRVVGALDTGGGKTVIFAALAKGAVEKKKRVLILTDRILLTGQAAATLKAFGLQTCGLDGGLFGGVYVGTVQAAQNRLDKMPRPDVVIIDECHEGIFRKALKWWPDAVYIGFTGTPISGSKKQPLNADWQKCVSSISRPELLEMGRLVPLTFRETKTNLEGLVKTSMGEFSEQSQLKVFGTEALYTALQKELEKAPARKTIIFCAGVEAVHETAKRLAQWGHQDVRTLTGETPEAEREEALATFAAAPAGFLVNCMVATKGFDQPAASRAVLLFATASLAKYYQTVGRVCRCAPGKTEAEVWDYGGNLARFWHPDAAVDWVGIFDNPPKSGNGVAPVKECPACKSFLHTSAPSCTFCGYTFPVKAKAEATADGLALKDAAAEENPVPPALKTAKTRTDVKRALYEAALRSPWEAKALAQAGHKAGVLRKADGEPYKQTAWTFIAAEAIWDAAKAQGKEPIAAVGAVYGHLPADFYQKIVQKIAS